MTNFLAKQVLFLSVAKNNACIIKCLSKIILISLKNINLFI
nr:MAG TPA: hypothetical protein [Bacteriophage sp.]